LLATLLLLALAWAGALRSPGAHAASIGQLQQQISAGQGQISTLSGQLSATSAHLSQLNGSIAALESKIAGIQADLDVKRARLIKLELQLNAARTRLQQLEAMEARGEQVLSQQLVSSYESDQPDLVTVVLESSGFQDLLERVQFVGRIQKQDVKVVTRVKRERKAVADQAIVLGALEKRQQALTTQVLRERDSLAAIRLSLLRQQVAVAQIKARQAGALQSAKDQVSNLQDQLNQAQAAQARQAAQAAGVTTSGVPAGSSGGFTFPLPKDAASPPGTWSEDQGVDISAPGDTPEFAVCPGTIVLHGIGGFGPDAPVLHCDSPIGGYDYVYYGHAGPANQLPVGTHVSAGQVMSSIGPGIVGISTGPHLEIGFSDGSGSPIGGGSASTMMSLLQASY
jgi:murein DD-endopeptidase MepM/ murein hydrolase activator NlpD